MSLERLTKQFKKEHGVTLVELLAAIAILSIIVTAFLALFTQAGRTNSMIDDKNKATFIAVEEMEKITNLSQQELAFSQMKNVYLSEGSGYTLSVRRLNSDSQLEVTTSTDGYTVTLHVIKKTDVLEKPTNLYHAIVDVEGGRNNAKMQSVLPFEKQIK